MTLVVDRVDQCSSDPCSGANSVNCTDGYRNFTCLCKPGFAGHRCEIGEQSATSKKYTKVYFTLPVRAGVCRPCVDTKLTATEKSATYGD